VKSNSAAPERICAFGHEGTGKTKGWAEIAKSYRETDTPGTFRVLNWEGMAMERLSDGYPDMRANVEWTDVHSWTELVMATTAYKAVSRPGDWLVIENAARCWDAVQQAYEEHYANQQGFKSDELFTTVPVDESPGRWVKINQEYFRWMDPLVDICPAHLYVTAPQKPVTIPQGKKGEWADDQQTVSLFSRFGMKPDSQKRLAHQMHTVLWLRTPRSGTWTMTSVKDRERELKEDEVMLTFPLSYLVGVAGWDTP